MKIKVNITYDTPYSKDIAESIKVDNVDIPEGMSIELKYEENKIVVEVSMEIKEAKNILTLRNTVDEILQHIITIEKTLTKLSP